MVKMTCEMQFQFLPQSIFIIEAIISKIKIAKTFWDWSLVSFYHNAIFVFEIFT